MLELPSYLKLSGFPWCGHATFRVLIGSLMDIWLLHLLALVNNAAVSVGVHVHVQVPIFTSSGSIAPGVKLLHRG